MREIKFRAWLKYVKKIVEVFEIDFQSKTFYSYHIEHDFDKAELMQYTGMKDLDGIEIYEGDLVNISNGRDPNAIYEVKFEDGCFIIFLAGGYSACLCEYMPEIKVVGNKWEVC